MTEKGKKFLKEIQENKALKSELNALNQKFVDKADDSQGISECVIEIAKKHGYELDASDFKPNSNEISDDEIAAVAGGGTTCVCSVAGGGGGTDVDGETVGCACVGYGQGGDAHNNNAECMCVIVGQGC